MLTQRQLQLLRFVERHLREHGVPPSFEEMRCSLDLKSKSGIHRLITGLEERGYIRRLPYRARAIEVVRLPSGWHAPPAVVADEGDGGNVVKGRFPRGPREAEPLPDSGGAISLPLYGRIAAGTPIEALSDHSRYVEVPTALLRSGEHYALEVVGDSMIDVGILEGDMAIIQRAETADSGTIVVALVDDREATLKRLRRKGASIALEAANPNYETRIFGPGRVKIQGRLVGLVRSY